MTTSGAAARPQRPGAAGDRLAALLRHSLPRFLMSGGISAALDIALLYVLHGMLNVQLTIATFIAVLGAFVVNFMLNREWSFGSESGMGGQFIRYLVLAGVNWISTVVLVSGLAALGFHYLLAKVLTLALNATVNYVAYRCWVFKPA